MESILFTLATNSTTHLVAVLLAAIFLRKPIGHFFMGIWMDKVDRIAAVQKERESHYKEIPLMQMEIKYMKEWQSKSDERYDILDKKIDDLTKIVTELAALVKQDLDNKNKGD